MKLTFKTDNHFARYCLYGKLNKIDVFMWFDDKPNTIHIAVNKCEKYTDNSPCKWMWIKVKTTRNFLDVKEVKEFIKENKEYFLSNYNLRKE